MTELTAHQARRRLSRPANDGPTGPAGWTRRGFLGALGAGAFGAASLGEIAADLFRGDLPTAWAGSPIGPADGILVLITLYGGNDGLNTVVPYTDPVYYASRPNIAIAPGRVLPIDGGLGLHPELGFVKQRYDAGQVAIVQGIGANSPDLSHFASMATWMRGTYSTAPTPTGWLGRWLDGLAPDQGPFAGASIDSSLPLHMSGAKQLAIAVNPNGRVFGASQTDADSRIYAAVRAFGASPAGRGQWHDAYVSSMIRQLGVATDAAPALVPVGGAGPLTEKLTIAARLINRDIGLRVIDVGLNGFDHHDGEPARHTVLLRDLDAALRAFYATLDAAYASRVLLATVSEFGRTSWSNGSAGTDHGTANIQFVIGTAVKGGLKGAAPSLSELDANKRMRATVDFRSLYGNLLDRWLGGGGTDVLGGVYDDLDVLSVGPGGSPLRPLPVIVSAPSAPAGYAPLTPVRVFDTRDGTGGRAHQLGAGETWPVVFAGRAGVPSDATAVAVNLTSVNATAPSFVTVWPAGDSRPFTANLNPVPGLPVPNLVVARLGTDGTSNFYNFAGTLDLVGDLVGWFGPSAPNRLTPLTPFRLLDTRDGTGLATPGPLGPGATLDLVVAGRGGVPVDATAAALNITVTQPSAPSFLTAWPAGAPRPLAASVNMVAGQTVPNLVLAPLGTGGRVSLYNYDGSTHVVADVLAAFGPVAQGRFVTITPVRVLDTRDGTGAPRGPIGPSPLTLPLAGVRGIPATGVVAVLLNVTVVQPTSDTYVTVYPSGVSRPLAANLNAVAGQIVPNMVVARLGVDGAAVVFNFAGSTDLVADAMGYFVA